MVCAEARANCITSSYGNHLFWLLVQAIEALPGVREIVALDKNLLFL